MTENAFPLARRDGASNIIEFSHGRQALLDAKALLELC